jgi:F-type H+-transporting ATPase subunit b
MTKVIETTKIGLIFPMTLFFLLALANSAFAAEGQASWRPTYDLVMSYVNFCILVAALVKMLKKPLKQFLAGSKKTISSQIERVESRKSEAEKTIRETRQTIAESDTRLEGIKTRILEQGKQRKQTIIDEARQQSRQMLVDAKKRIDHQILQARDAFRAELVDSAIDIATKKIPQIFSADDDKRLVKAFIGSAQK